MTGSDFQKVAVDPKQRGGLLSQPSLVARAHPLDPRPQNPPLRGRIIRDRFYCDLLNPVHMPLIPPRPELSIRQFYATVTAGISDSVPCVRCHYGFELNALGFPFEGFDTLGRTRTVDDRNHPLELNGIVQNGLGAEASYDSLVELSAILAENPEVQACFGRYWSGFAHGSPAADSPMDTDPSIQAAFKGADLNLRALIAAVVSSEAFLAVAGSKLDGGAGGHGESSGSDCGGDVGTPPGDCSVPAILSKHRLHRALSRVGYHVRGWRRLRHGDARLGKETGG